MYISEQENFRRWKS